MSKNVSKLAILFVSFGLLVGCGHHFTCTKQPAWNDYPERQCDAHLSPQCVQRGDCFHSKRAWCFQGSVMWETVDRKNGKQPNVEHEKGSWSPYSQPYCAPSPDECESLRSRFKGQPPMLTVCRETSAREDPTTSKPTWQR